MDDDFSSRFANHRERFLRLRDDSLTDEQGSNDVWYVAALAAKTTLACQDAGHLAWLDPIWKLTNSSCDDEVAQWAAKWQKICKLTAKQFSEQLLESVGVQRGIQKFGAAEIGPGLTLPSVTMSVQRNADWRQRAEDYATVCKVLAESVNPDDNPELQPDTQRDESPLTQLEKALALLVSHPEWSDTQIAAQVGVNRTTLYKPAWQRFQQARIAMATGRQERARGAKDSETGAVEGWKDDE